MLMQSSACAGLGFSHSGAASKRAKSTRCQPSECGPKPVRFLQSTCLPLSPAMSEQKKLLSFPPLPSGIVYVNDHVCFRTEETQRVISVHGVLFAHYDIGDRAAEAYTMITLWESE